MRAAEMATEAGFGPAKVYWTAVPRSVLAAGIEAFARVDREPVRRREERRRPAVRYPRRAGRARGSTRTRSTTRKVAAVARARHPDPAGLLAVHDRRQLRRASSWAWSTTPSRSARRGRARARTAGKVISLPASTEPVVQHRRYGRRRGARCGVRAMGGHGQPDVLHVGHSYVRLPLAVVLAIASNAGLVWFTSRSPDIPGCRCCPARPGSASWCSRPARRRRRPDHHR